MTLLVEWPTLNHNHWPLKRFERTPYDAFHHVETFIYLFTCKYVCMHVFMWVGPIHRMRVAHRRANQIFHWVPEGRKRRGRPRKNWTETVENNLRGLKTRSYFKESLQLRRNENMSDLKNNLYNLISLKFPTTFFSRCFFHHSLNVSQNFSVFTFLLHSRTYKFTTTTAVIAILQQLQITFHNCRNCHQLHVKICPAGNIMGDSGVAGDVPSRVEKMSCPMCTGWIKV